MRLCSWAVRWQTCYFLKSLRKIQAQIIIKRNIYKLPQFSQVKNNAEMLPSVFRKIDFFVSHFQLSKICKNFLIFFELLSQKGSFLHFWVALSKEEATTARFSEAWYIVKKCTGGKYLRSTECLHTPLPRCKEKSGGHGYMARLEYYGFCCTLEMVALSILKDKINPDSFIW